MTTAANGVTSPLVTSESRSPKRWIIGDPLPSHHLDAQLLPKHLALPIFASDPLSSVAYAPQELLLILSLGGVAFLAFAPWVALAVIVLLATIVVSYRRLIKAYPGGGGDYEVAYKNLGEKPALVVASALLVDYILTVAVSVASGVDNIISALPVLNDARIELAAGFVILLAAMNLRGVRESGRTFALPTYVFIGSLGLLVVTGLVRTVLGDSPVAESAQFAVQAEELTQAGAILLLLRAFASGCSALTGVEAISNGVPAFRRPKIRNAQQTLVLMGGIAITLFAGVTALALISGVHYVENACHLIGWGDCATHPQRSVIAQLAAAVFGDNSALFFLVQAAIAAVLLLAANTAFNGFPLLSSVLARNLYAPKALQTRGDRLVLSNGVVVLSLAAILLLLVYRANLTQLIQLYIIGVFVSFTLGQSGMVRHWIRMLRAPRRRKEAVSGLIINGFGAAMTASVLVIVTITKFTHGAWLVFVIMPALFALMLGTNRYYRKIEQQITVDDSTVYGSQGDHAIVLVGRMQQPTLKALDYAIAARHDSLEAVHIAIDDDAAAELERAWERQNIEVPLRIVASPYRDISQPLIDYIRRHREEHGSEVVTVYLPQYIVGHWWENLLHNHKARRIRQKLMLFPGVTVALVPWLLDSSKALFQRQPRPMPGQDRRGEPRRPVVRKQLAPAKRRRRS